MPIFRADADYRHYLDLLARFKKKIPCRCYHLCLMPNHLHFLLQAELVDHVTAMMRRLQQAFQLYWRKQYRLVGHLWQGRFKSLPIDTESYLLECARYIERNPIRAKLSATPEAYPWSSAQIYLRGPRKGWEFLDLSPAYRSFGKRSQTQIKHYRNFLLQPRPYDRLVDAQFNQLT